MNEIYLSFIYANGENCFLGGFFFFIASAACFSLARIIFQDLLCVYHVRRIYSGETRKKTCLSVYDHQHSISLSLSLSDTFFVRLFRFDII